MDLIRVQKNPRGQTVVSARELYKFLGYNITAWKRWYEKNITGNEFAVENEDWQVFDIVSKSSEEGFQPNIEKSENGRPTKDFALTLNFAKKLAMMSRSKEGEKLRDYFIECERKMLAAPVLSTLDLMELGMRQMREHETRLNVMEQKVMLIEAKTTTRPDYFTVVGYATLQGISVNLNMAARIGKEATKLCAERGLLTDEIPDPRFGKVKMYPESVLYDVFQKPI